MNGSRNFYKFGFAAGFVVTAILFLLVLSPGLLATVSGHGGSGAVNNQASLIGTNLTYYRGTTAEAEADLAGTWSAVVNSAEGRWNYTMALKRQSAGKWAGTLSFTLDGKSPSTTEVSVESLGSGKMNLIWRPGKPNAQSFEGTYTKDRINVAGFGGELQFTRR